MQIANSLEKTATEDRIAGWHHQLSGHESEKNLGDSGQGSLVCCRPWGLRELDTTERLNSEQQQRCLCVSWAMMSRDQGCRNHQPASTCYLWGLGSFRHLGVFQAGKGKAWCNRCLGKQTSHRLDWPFKRQLAHLPEGFKHHGKLRWEHQQEASHYFIKERIWVLRSWRSELESSFICLQ